MERDRKGSPDPDGRLRLERLQFLTGISTPKLLRLLLRHRLRVSPEHLRDLGGLLFVSLCASLCDLQDGLSAAPDPGDMLPPLFIVGHWRSGTTWLHKLLSLDPALHAPTFFECCVPQGFRSGAGWLKARIAAHLPPHRPLDDAPFGIDEPFEDEFALAKTALVSPMLEAVFPRGRARYRRQLTPAGMTAGERRAWDGAMLDFARRLTAAHGKRLLFKSPAHSFRVPELRALFPGAKFIVLKRDPMEVIASTLKVERLNLQHNALQPAPEADEAWVIRRYLLLERHLEQALHTLPREDAAELHYAELCRDPAAATAALYARLGLPDSGKRRQALAAYLTRPLVRTLKTEPPARDRMRWQALMASQDEGKAGRSIDPIQAATGR